jgi:hypothetical protein
MGFTLAQGFLYGHPELPKRLVPASSESLHDTNRGGETRSG